MNINKYLITGLLALTIGFGAGYVIFSKKSDLSHLELSYNNETGTSNDTFGAEQIWTCSMDPQVRQNEPGQCPICGMDLIPLESNSSTDPLILKMTNEAVKLANIQTLIIGEGVLNSQKIIKLSGKVKADERLASTLVAHVPGRIEKLFVTFTGEEVTKGQKLATIYSPELIAAQGELLEASKLKELNPGLLEAARNKLRFWKIENATIEEILEKGVIQETFTLYADDSGIVTNKRRAVGDYLKQGEPLFELNKLNNVWVLFDAYEEDLSRISVGDLIEFTTPSIPNKTFKTRITFIDPVINPVTRVASLRTEVSNLKASLKPEMFVNGTLKKEILNKELLSIPKSAVLWTGTRSVAYLKVPDTDIPSFQFREIELGQAMGNSYQLISGLNAGDEIVTNGSFTIDAAAQLNNQASMMNRFVSKKLSRQLDQLPDFTESTPIEFKQQLASYTKAYLSLKEAFVATNMDQTIISSKEALSQLSLIDMSLLNGEAHLYWMEQFNAIQAHTLKISETKNIDEQRKQFSFLSNAVINSVQAFGVAGIKLFVDYCPMAIENKGAEWLSDTKEIRNPYFGDRMLTCGKIKDTINKNLENPPILKTVNPLEKIHNH